MRNKIATILLFLSWPVCLIHRYWNNTPERVVSWIIYDKTVSQDFRWYWVYNELWMSATLVLLAFTICSTKTKVMRIMLIALLVVSGIDIANYWLWFRRSENMLYLESITMFVAMALIFKNKVK